MIELYTASTPNGWKVSIALEELGLPYTVKPIQLDKGEQKQPDYLRINPNGRIPAIIDRGNNDLTIFESGAILLYLAEQTGRLMPADPAGRFNVVQWLMFQMGGVGPMQGQANVFYRYFPEKIPAVIERYHNETRRLYGVIEGQLQGRDYLCDEYSIADIANFSWISMHEWAGIAIDDMPNLQAWVKRIGDRAAVKRGLAVPVPLDFSAIDSKREAEMVKTAQTLLTR